jgi:type I restriction enzyme, R subunit
LPSGRCILPAVAAPTSVNFSFLAAYDERVAIVAAQAERLFAEDPHAALGKLRLFGELLARLAAANAGLYTTVNESQVELLGRLAAQGVIKRDTADLFHLMRKAGNVASHDLVGGHREALQLLRIARELGLWFHRMSGAPADFRPGPFVPPPDPRAETQALAEQLSSLRRALAEAQGAQEAARLQVEHEASLRADAEARAQQAALEGVEWKELALMTDAERAKLEAELTARQATQQSEHRVAAFVARAEEAGKHVQLDEAQTRILIDAQLREAGWEADTVELTYEKGARPAPHKFRAIAEWPVQGGRADYALFIGLTVVGVVEAKRETIDVAGAIDQSKRYSRGLLHADFPGASPWRAYRVPFLFSTNGRPYLAQLESKSGIHFLDVRRKENHSKALPGWYTPQGLEALLGQDVTDADDQLARKTAENLGLRDYQIEVIHKVERGIREGRRAMLVAMATGTGKTKTAIGLMYRLLWAKRVRRVLFLVDRSSLGDQTEDAFKEMRLEQMRTFTDIYEVRGLKNLKSDKSTKVHIATVQAMVKRVLYSEHAPPVDEYDFIIVDECHRGYVLDRELADDEINFRDQDDYISKYRRVLDYFDAIKVGLTATPALHTVDIFGAPIATYSYRDAVINGHLIDHEPPLALKTQNSADGITWSAGEEMILMDRGTGELNTVTLPDEVKLDVESFNHRVITESFNRVVCEWLAKHIDPNLDEKTIIFCVTDAHADMVVAQLKVAFDAAYGGVDDDLVKKVTGRSDNPKALIRRFKNERDPNVAVTVDLLSTGVDIPRVCNIVFLRRIKSRILYDQMLGRATRPCNEIGKTAFHVYDAVDLYRDLRDFSEMKPVVVNPAIGFQELIADIARAEESSLRERLVDQLIAKLRAKERRMSDEMRERFLELTGLDPKAFADQLRAGGADAATEQLGQLHNLGESLDNASGVSQPYIVSMHNDQFRSETHGYGVADKPEDYLEAFNRYLRENVNKVPALIAVTQRPRDLTRAQLRELRTLLDQQGFREPFLQRAWQQAGNADIAASIIGFIRQAALGEALLPYSERVDRALQQIGASRKWSAPQLKWLKRIGDQLKLQTLLDATSFDEDQFRQDGGFKNFDKRFDGKLVELLGDIQDAIWPTASAS